MHETDDFDAFYYGSFRRLLRYASGFAVNLDDADDLVQMAYARAWLRWRSLRDHEEPEVWLRGLVTRLATDHRRRAMTSPAGGTSGMRLPGVEALKAFPRDQRRVLVLRFLLDRSLEQISEETDTDPGIVESWLARGREAGVAELLPTMGSQADQVEGLSPVLIREASAKRLRRQRTVLACLLVLAVIAISGGITLLVNRTEPATSPPPEHGAMVPLHQIGPGVAYGPGGLTGQPLTAIRQGRAFATWQQSDSTFVMVAIDLQSGEQVWRHDEEQVGACRTLSGSDEILLCRYQKTGSTAQEVIAFDSADGDVLWRYPLSRQLMRFGDIVVVDGDQDLIGLNLRTGEKIWTIAAGAIEDTQITPMMSSGSSDSATEPADGWKDHRLAIMNVNGGLRFVNTDSGAVTFESTIATAGRLDSLAAVDGTAFAGDGTHLYSVSASGQIVVHTAPASRRLIRATPCGAGHLCVAEQSTQRYDLVIVDVAKKQPLWRVNTTAVPTANTNSGFYFITAGNEVQVFDSAGAQVESFSTDAEIPTFIGPDRVLRIHGDLVSAKPVGISLSVGNISATTTIPIGQLVAFARGCSPNTTTVVCPTNAAVTVWRYVDY
jgi:RNA polymerase sigma-70 factor (ECF subfamily)